MKLVHTMSLFRSCTTIDIFSLKTIFIVRQLNCTSVENKKGKRRCICYLELNGRHFIHCVQKHYLFTERPCCIDSADVIK